jgi:dihydrofolate synthase/folylpolyglutamate synthase
MTAAPERLTYADAVRELQARGRFGVSLGLERIDAILDELGRPERRLRGALVAGTNGKGSVVALAGSVLRAAGLRVGSMPKPHLVSYRERIAIDGEPLAPGRFAAAIARVLPAADRVGARLGAPTEFEVLTAAAYAELARAEPDLVLVEVGLGGRLDATNTLDPGVAVITNVAHDHERHLGRTLGAIGGEKAAIIKRGDLAVTGATGRGLAPILARSSALDVPLRRCGSRLPYRATVRSSGWEGLTVDLVTPDGRLPDVRIGLLGSHQAANAAVAIATLDALREAGAREGSPLSLAEADLRAGLAAARWPGRLELLVSAQHGRVLLDGAHNPAGAVALATALAELGLRGFPLVLGAMRGKRVSGVLRALAPLRPRPVFTAASEHGALPPEALLRAWRRIGGAGGSVAGDTAEALRRAASDRRAPDQPVVVAGSLYLVGAVRGMLT